LREGLIKCASAQGFTLASRIAILCLSLPVWAQLAGCSIAPVALTSEQIADSASLNFSRVTLGQEAVHGAISLNEAIARALKYNLDHRVEMMNVSLRSAEASLASLDMLPKLVANAGYVARDSDYTARSLDIPLGIETDIFAPPPRANSISSEREYNENDVTFSWNILDFALSYVRANQAADRHLIALETKRKIIQRIVEDTRTAYLRALSSDRVSRRLAKIEGRVKSAIARSRTTSSSGAETPLTALSYERELVQIRQVAQQLQHELNLARAQLAALMDIAPGTDFKLVDHEYNVQPFAFDLSAEEMVAEAIFNRSEIREVAYQQRITEREATAALLEVLPGLKIHGADAFDSNQFLLHNDWVSWGLAASGNLIKVIQLPAKRATIAAQGEVLDQKALAVTMVVMTQVYVGRTRYRHAHEAFLTAKEYLAVQGKLVQQLRAEASADLVGEQTLIREEMNLLVAEVQRDISFADLQNAAGTMISTLGYDVQAREIDLSLDVKALSSHLGRVWSDRASLSDRGLYLADIARAKEEARRKAAEEERRRREDARRVAEAAAAAKAEEVRLAKIGAQKAADDAKTVKELKSREAKAELARLRQEAAAAKLSRWVEGGHGSSQG
jgi:outer membrane protein TolC